MRGYTSTYIRGEYPSGIFSIIERDNESLDISFERSVLILVSVEYSYVYSTCQQGYP